MKKQFTENQVAEIYSGWFLKMLDSGRNQNEFLPVLIRSAKFWLGISEKWMDAVGFEGWYECSNFGRIKSHDRLMINSHRNGVKLIKGRILKISLDNNGYQTTSMKVLGDEYRDRSHRVVYNSFVGSLIKGLVVDHKDRIKSNNFVLNLQQITTRENTSKDKYLLNPNSKYPGVMPANSRFQARVRINGDKFYIGAFDTEIEAHDACNFAISLNGDMYLLNKLKNKYKHIYGKSKM